MNIYEEGIKRKIRFQTSTGLLTMEQLDTVKKTPLGIIVRNLKKELNKSTDDDELSFLDENAAPVDRLAQLRFEIAKDMYIKLVEAEKLASARKEDKNFDQEIDELIAAKLQEERKSLSIDELRALKKNK